MASDWSADLRVLRPVASDLSGGVGFVRWCRAGLWDETWDFWLKMDMTCRADRSHISQLRLVYVADAINPIKENDSSRGTERVRPRLAGRTSCRIPRHTRLPPNKLNLPSLELVVAFNAAVRHNDEWFDEEDDLDRIARILEELQTELDPLVAAAIATSRIARSQSFTEGNKRTALLVGRWILDRNGFVGSRIVPKGDLELAHLLLKAARGGDVGKQVTELFRSRL